MRFRIRNELDKIKAEQQTLRKTNVVNSSMYIKFLKIRVLLLVNLISVATDMT